MNAWYDTENMGLSYCLSEDVGAPELRNPNNSGMRSRSWISRLVKMVRR